MEDRDKLYQALFKSYVLAYPSKSKRTCQDEPNSKWNEIKTVVTNHLRKMFRSHTQGSKPQYCNQDKFGYIN